MDVTKIPFVKKIGIQKNKDGNLLLKFDNEILNHLETVHASAQFTLAETASGEYLYSLFPDLVTMVIPVMRESKIKYKNRATKDLIAYASVSEQSCTLFREQLAQRAWALISVHVEIRDIDELEVCSAEFKWFIQKNK